MITIREASRRLCLQENFLGHRRSIKDWPQGIKLVAVPRKGLMMDESMLPKLEAHFQGRLPNQEERQSNVYTK
jgi:hypothetical protein